MISPSWRHDGQGFIQWILFAPAPTTWISFKRMNAVPIVIERCVTLRANFGSPGALRFMKKWPLNAFVEVNITVYLGKRSWPDIDDAMRTSEDAFVADRRPVLIVQSLQRRKAAKLKSNRSGWRFRPLALPRTVGSTLSYSMKVQQVRRLTFWNVWNLDPYR